MAKGNNQKSNDSGLNFEAQLWAAADKMRGHIDASEYIGFNEPSPVASRHPLPVGEGRGEGRSKRPYGSLNVLGRVYEYFLGKFASAEGTLQSATAICGTHNDPLSASNGERVGVRCRIQRNADSFRTDLHLDLKADFVPVLKDLANPPFYMSDWGGEHLRPDVRWKFGMPPVNNANYAWIQHFLHHVSMSFADNIESKNLCPLSSH